MSDNRWDLEEMITSFDQSIRVQTRLVIAHADALERSWQIIKPVMRWRFRRSALRLQHIVALRDALAAGLKTIMEHECVAPCEVVALAA